MKPPKYKGACVRQKFDPAYWYTSSTCGDVIQRAWYWKIILERRVFRSGCGWTWVKI